MLPIMAALLFESLLFVLELTGARARVLGKVGGVIAGTRDHISKQQLRERSLVTL